MNHNENDGHISWISFENFSQKIFKSIKIAEIINSNVDDYYALKENCAPDTLTLWYCGMVCIVLDQPVL